MKSPIIKLITGFGCGVFMMCKNYHASDKDPGGAALLIIAVVLLAMAADECLGLAFNANHAKGE